MDGVARCDRPTGFGRRFVYLLATPWWRAVWVVGAIVWFFVFVGLVATVRGFALALAALGAVPLLTVFLDIARRQRVLRNR
jgi:hypothetical protein